MLFAKKGHTYHRKWLKGGQDVFDGAPTGGVVPARVVGPGFSEEFFGYCAYEPIWRVRPSRSFVVDFWPFPWDNTEAARKEMKYWWSWDNIGAGNIKEEFPVGRMVSHSTYLRIRGGYYGTPWGLADNPWGEYSNGEEFVDYHFELVPASEWDDLPSEVAYTWFVPGITSPLFELNKSTVPVTTGDEIEKILSKKKSD